MGTVSYKLMHKVVERELVAGIETRIEQCRQNMSMVSSTHPNYLTLIEAIKTHTVNDCINFRVATLEKYKDYLGDNSCGCPDHQGKAEHE